MDASLFHLVVVNKDKSAHELLELLEPAAPGLFSALEDDAELPRANLKEILLYLVYAYSKESPYLVMGDQIAFTRENVRSVVGLPDVLYDAVVKLRSDTVRQITLKYLEHQGNRIFRHLIRKHELYEAMMDDQMLQLNETDDNGRLDTKKLVESARMADQLLADIEKLEAEMRKEYAFIFDNFKAVRQEQPGKVTSLAIEQHTLVR